MSARRITNLYWSLPLLVWWFFGFSHHEVVVLLVALPLTAFGVVGLVQRRITTRGKSGPYRTYIGADAIRPSLFFVAVGGTLSIIAVVRLWPSIFGATR